MTKKKKTIIIILIVVLLGLGFMLYPRTGCNVKIMSEGSVGTTYTPKYYFYLGDMIVLRTGTDSDANFIITNRKNVVIYKVIQSESETIYE